MTKANLTTTHDFAKKLAQHPASQEMTPEELSDKCLDISLLLHFYLNVGDLMNWVSELSCEGMPKEQPQRFHALMAVLDTALQGRREDETYEAISFLEKINLYVDPIIRAASEEAYANQS